MPEASFAAQTPLPAPAGLVGPSAHSKFSLQVALNSLAFQWGVGVGRMAGLALGGEGMGGSGRLGPNSGLGAPRASEGGVPSYLR